MRVFSSRK